MNHVRRTVIAALAAVMSLLATAGPASAAPINDFEASFATSTAAYVKAVTDAQNTLRAKTTNPTLTPAFADTFTRATGAGFSASVYQADGTLKSNLKSGLYPKDVAKDRFVSSVNVAKDNYFNTVEGAKNDVANRANQAGVGAPKDEFMNRVNQVSATYANALAQMTNQLVATL